jgi:hypothetical protein
MTAPAARDPQPVYLCRMMERLGIEPGGAALPRLSLHYAAAFRRCGACPSRQACGDWLAQAQPSASLAPRFCPNADIFFELKLDPAGRAA